MIRLIFYSNFQGLVYQSNLNSLNYNQKLINSSLKIFTKLYNELITCQLVFRVIVSIILIISCDLYNFCLFMSRVVLYSIVSETQVIEKWICSTRAELKNFVEKVMKRLSQTKSKTIRTLQVEGLWIYYFHQQTFLFVLAAQGPERSVRMQNYLRVMTELFYENYDEKRFATIIDRIMNQINKIQSGQTSSQENEGLISGSSLKHDKQKFTRILAEKQQNSKRAYLVTVILFICILALGIYYLLRKTKD